MHPKFVSLLYGLSLSSVVIAAAAADREYPNGRHFRRGLATMPQSPEASNKHSWSHENVQAVRYDVGLGACGTVSTPDDMVVYLNSAEFHPPSGDTVCNKTITVSYLSTVVTATIVGECRECPPGGLGFSPGLFKKFASEAVDALPVNWSYRDYKRAVLHANTIRPSRSTTSTSTSSSAPPSSSPAPSSFTVTPTTIPAPVPVPPPSSSAPSPFTLILTPISTSAPTPTHTPTPIPVPTPDPTPTSTSTPDPTPTPIPVYTPTPSSSPPPTSPPPSSSVPTPIPSPESLDSDSDDVSWSTIIPVVGVTYMGN